MRSRGGASSALGAERAERERERAALLRHARDEAERSLQLAAALSARDTQLRHAREQLFEVGFCTSSLWVPFLKTFSL